MSGDLVLAVGGQPVASLAQFYRRLWALGNAGVEVPLDIVRDGRLAEVIIESDDRSKFYLTPKLH